MHTRQNVFHSTSVINAISIITDDAILDKTTHIINNTRYTGVSTTRSKSFATNWNIVTFELDGDAIQYNNKIIPVDFVNYQNHYNIQRRSNSEEFIVDSLKNLSNKILSFHFKSTIYMSDYYDDLLDAIHNNYENATINYI
jgi:hypothetical protein